MVLRTVLGACVKLIVIFYSDTRITESITILMKKFYFAIPKKIVMVTCNQNFIFVWRITEPI